MTGIAVGDGLEKNGPPPFLDQALLALNCVHYRKRIVAIDAFGMHGIGIYARANAGQAVKGHGFPGGLSTHAVKIIHEVEDDGQPTLHGIIPQFPELAHGGKVHGLPGRSASHRGIPNVRNYDTILAVYFLEEGRPHRDIGRPSHDGVVGQDPKRRKEGMHGPS